MTAALLLAVLLAGVDDLGATRVGDLTLRLPSAWKHELGSDLWDAPSKDASFKLTVYPVEPRRDGKLCVDQLVKALGQEGWEPILVGDAPAARKIATETQAPEPQTDAAPPPAIAVQTNSYVGCNGATKWVLSLSMNAKKKTRFDKLAKKILESITYAKLTP